jgi:error-prone DNA polymerase
VLLARSEIGYRNICRLITRARMTGARDEPWVHPEWLEGTIEGVVLLDGGRDGPIGRALRAGDRRRAEETAKWLSGLVPEGDFWLEMSDHCTHEERRLAARIDDLGEHLGIPRLVTGDVRHATPQEKPVYDLLTCVRHRTRFPEAGTRLLPNAQWHLTPIEELEARWSHRPDLLRQTAELASKLTFRFEELQPQLPFFPRPDRFATDDDFLAHLTWEGARIRYPDLNERHRRQIRHELNMIRSRGMAGYFLITWDVARFCRERGILCQGRGSAANSAVCYCLLITAVDPIGMELLFERFISEGRKEYPDIDIDISHEWREEAIQYVYRRYGRDRAALVCEQIRYRARSALRDTAWALGFEQEQIDRLAGQIGRHRGDSKATGDWIGAEGARAAGLSTDDPRLPLLAHLVDALQGIPRHRSIHVGGMILTADPLCEYVPIEAASMPNRTIIQWEKDDLPYSGLAKFDLLGLGMLSMLQKALGAISADRGEPFDLASIPPDDPVVYDALCRADTLGVFQIESRAQMNTLPRLKPRRFYDLVVQIALIRPGPIQGNMVHPYLRRRAGLEPVEYLHPDLEPILKRTLGIPIFQEQVMRIAIELADFTPSQADELRRAMGFRRYSPKMERLDGELDAGMRRRGIEKGVRDDIKKFLMAFGHYGFPESHSASFALLAYASSWLKVHHAPLFAACLINSQPMGFYSNASIVQDARVHDVQCLAPDLRYSAWDCTLEPATKGPWPKALRIGLRCIQRLGKRAEGKLEEARGSGPFRSIRDVIERTGLNSAALASMAQAGAFDGFIGPEGDTSRRRKALWEVLREGRIPTDGLDRFGVPEPVQLAFDELTRGELIAQDYLFSGLSTAGHPMEILRPELEERRVLTAEGLKRAKNGTHVKIAGMLIVRQRPQTAKGFMFLSVEDETGIANIIVHPNLQARYHETLRTAAFIEVHGKAQIEGNMVQLIAKKIFKLDGGGAPVTSRNFR